MVQKSVCVTINFVTFLRNTLNGRWLPTSVPYKGYDHVPDRIRAISISINGDDYAALGFLGPVFRVCTLPECGLLMMRSFLPWPLPFKDLAFCKVSSVEPSSTRIISI